MHWRSPIFSFSVLVRDPSEQNDCCNWETGMNVGFVGLGIMGAPMAGHLQKGGHALFLYDLSPDLPEDLLAGGAVACDSGRAVAEALVLAAKAGADPATVRQALMGGAAASMILENHGARMLEGNFEPGFRAELQQKDLNVALSAARDLGVVLPLTATAEGLYNALNARGQAKADHSAVVTILEELAACRVAPQKPKDREPS